MVCALCSRHTAPSDVTRSNKGDCEADERAAIDAVAQIGGGSCGGPLFAARAHIERAAVGGSVIGGRLVAGAALRLRVVVRVLRLADCARVRLLEFSARNAREQLVKDVRLTRTSRARRLSRALLSAFQIPTVKMIRCEL